MLAQVKCNVGPMGHAVTFSVADGVVEWLNDDPRTADEALGNVFTGLGRPDTQLQIAKEVLEKALSDGARQQQEIMSLMHNNGIGESTAKKAKAQLGIVSKKQGLLWFWALPNADERIQSF